MENNFTIDGTVGDVTLYICIFTHNRTEFQLTNIKCLSKRPWKLPESLKSCKTCVWVMAPQAHTDNLGGCSQEVIRDIGQAC